MCIRDRTRRARFADMWMKYFAEPVGETYKSVAPAVFREKVPTLDIKSIPYMPVSYTHLDTGGSTPNASADRKMTFLAAGAEEIGRTMFSIC